jgi:hypothetical protein
MTGYEKEPQYGGERRTSDFIGAALMAAVFFGTWAWWSGWL